ncbi:FIST N-terminal domain-containing protein [Actinocrispum sp. NPDC049592]|uniref:FIST signal transduction protein n=1 Tax=Actinocrispum sp. NPDC049592 TaxID=3154835 RepID=UPI003413231F
MGETGSHDRRWMGVARSGDTDSRTAGSDAALEAITGPDPKLLIVFFSISHDPHALLDGIRAAVPDIPIVGCSTHGEIAPGGPTDGTVVVTAIGGPGLAVSTAAVRSVSGRQREAGAEIAQCVAQVPDLPHRVLMMLTDGKIREQETILRGAYGVLGASIPFVGGAAGDGWRMANTLVLHDDQVLTDAVVGATIASEAPLSVAFGHGWQKTGEPMIVTSSHDGRVFTLDDKPAMDAYLDRLGAPIEAYTDAEAFRDFALARPLGVQRRSGVEARNLSTGIDLEGRSIGSAGAIDHGGLTWAMTGDETSILAATDTVCENALAELGERELVGMIAFSCAALRAVLGDDGIKRENERIAKWVRDAPFAGFYTYGEIARIRGIDGFHNQTLAVLAIS